MNDKPNTKPDPKQNPSNNPNDPNDPNKIVSVLTDVDLRQHARYRFADHGDFLSKPKS